MSLRVVLDPEDRSAAVARRVVEGALAKAGLGNLLDEALLLVTELVTNAVVHAGTLIDLDVEADEAGLRVEVADRGPGRLAMQGSPSEVREGGRGIFLLDALATAWGTCNFPDRKSVWFRLGDPGDRSQPPTVDVAAEPRRDLPFLALLPPDFERQLGPERVVAELLRRLVEGLGQDRGWIVAADGAGRWTVRAAYDDDPAPDPEAARRGFVPGCHSQPFLDPGGSPSGAVILAGRQPTADERALVRLVAERIGVILREEQNRAAQRRTRGSLALLAEAGEMFAGTLDVRLAATLAARLVVPRLAVWAAVWTTYGHGPTLHGVAHTDEGRDADLRAALTGPAAQALVAHVLAGNPTPTTRLRTHQVPFDDDGEVIVLPLVARRRVLGLLIARPAGQTGPGAEDTGLLVDLARMAALAVDNARLYEERSRVAAALQASLLPPDLPVVAGLQFGARYASAGEGSDVGGDFYDVFPLADGGWGIAIGDVCGKGASAAAITGIAREVLRLLSRDGVAPPQALARLNETLLGLGDRGRFCTAVLGAVRPGPQGVVVRFSGAGHPPPVHLTAAGEARFIGRAGTLLGVVAGVDLSDDWVMLAPGDSLVLYTDGVTERRGAGGMFGEANLLATLRGCAHRDAADIATALEAAAQRFDSGVVPRDDLAVLVVRAVG